MARHTVLAFDAELSALHETIAGMGGLAEEQLAAAVDALATRSDERAAAVVARDTEIDRAESDAEAKAIRLLALRQPMARDLREVVAALKIANNIERVGDFASNIAKRAMALSQLPPAGPMKSLVRMSKLAGAQVHEVIDAYVRQDMEKALAVRDGDAEIDAIYTSLFRELLTYMMESPQQITPCTHLLFVAKNIERIGDHATNIAENVCFLVRGKLPEDERTKEDMSSFTVLTPDGGGSR
ncbi:phosphate signaling complex protein PhoU [Arenibaculum sp.]|jgi:phosphate transport system protein|uniref:phosphate signaling complex protein PhoU n=1 Tax=Arenibaculum sp. TaxID=2865862 RepID=UPI002E0F30C0|nr:phosphate signaling complex protein PhoU [Arenibaculum sp.]